MNYRFDINAEQARQLRLVETLGRAMLRNDLVETLRHWDEASLTLLTRRTAVIVPAEQFTEFRCRFYGDELQERFGLDLTGQRFGDIPGFQPDLTAFRAYWLCYCRKLPHLSWIEPDADGAGSRIIQPILKDGVVQLLIASFTFAD